jgi:hypothetical protein
MGPFEADSAADSNDDITCCSLLDSLCLECTGCGEFSDRIPISRRPEDFLAHPVVRLNS